MTTLVCRAGRQRILIRTRRDHLPRPLYLGTLVDDDGRPSHRRYGGRPLRGETTQGVTLTTAPIRAGALTATGLCEVLTALDDDAGLFG